MHKTLLQNAVSFHPSHKHSVTMIYDHWNHAQAPHKKPPHLLYTHYNKARHEFLTSSQNKRSIRDKTQRNRINRMRPTSTKVHLCIFQQTGPNDGYVVQFDKPWSRLGKRKGDQGIVYKIGPGNRHWGAFAEKYIYNRTIRYHTKGAEPIMYCFRKMQPLGKYVACSLFYSSVFSDGALIWRRCQKFVYGLIMTDATAS